MAAPQSPIKYSIYADAPREPLIDAGRQLNVNTLPRLMSTQWYNTPGKTYAVLGATINAPFYDNLGQEHNGGIQLVSLVGYSLSTVSGMLSLIESPDTSPVSGGVPTEYIVRARFPVPAGQTFSLDSPIYITNTYTLLASAYNRMCLLFESSDNAGCNYTCIMKQVYNPEAIS